MNHEERCPHGQKDLQLGALGMTQKSFDKHHYGIYWVCLCDCCNNLFASKQNPPPKQCPPCR